MYGAVANTRPDSSPVSAGTWPPPRPPVSGPWTRAAARRPMAAVNAVAMTMAHSEGNRSAVSEVPIAAVHGIWVPEQGEDLADRSSDRVLGVRLVPPQ